jgi:hypothetical protein
VSTRKRAAEAPKVRDVEALLDRRYFVLDPEALGRIPSGLRCAGAPESASEEAPADAERSSSARTPVCDQRPVGGVSQFLSQFGFWAEPLARKPLILQMRRDVRVVEGARLESVCRGNSTEGSNPSLSANQIYSQK